MAVPELATLLMTFDSTSEDIVKQLEKERVIKRCDCSDCITSKEFVREAMRRQAEAISEEIKNRWAK